MAQARKRRKSRRKPKITRPYIEEKTLPDGTKKYHVEQTLPNGWVFIGEVVNARKYLREQLGDEEWIEDIPKNRYDYEVMVYDPKAGEILDRYSSHGLDYDTAKFAVNEVREDCLKGECDTWFMHLPK